MAFFCRIMKIEFEITGDGSHTLFVPALNEHYHSTFGSIAESRIVFIEAGLKPVLQNLMTVNLLEIGFGTGLNALLSFFETNNKVIHYRAFEAFPLEKSIFDKLNFCDFIPQQNAEQVFDLLHRASWNEEQKISGNFSLMKIHQKIEDAILPDNFFDLVYFDAFGPEVQPELWTQELFSKIGRSLKLGGVLTTYSAKGEIRRNLKNEGFIIEKLPGPPGKRHITRATKAI